MPHYEVGYIYKIEEFGAVELEATSIEDADEQGREHVYQSIPEATDITIDYVKEIKS